MGNFQNMIHILEVFLGQLTTTHKNYDEHSQN